MVSKNKKTRRQIYGHQKTESLSLNEAVVSTLLFSEPLSISPQSSSDLNGTPVPQITPPKG